MKTLVRNGTVVTPNETVEMDLLFAEGRIIALGRALSTDGAVTVDASGKYVLPGGVDIHTHITLDIDATGPDTYFSGTMPAACGGTTTVVDHMAFMPEGRALEQHIAAYRALAENKAAVDYGFHAVMQNRDEASLQRLKSLPGQGYTSIKAYMTYDNRLDDEALFKLLRRTNELDMLCAVHAENHDITTLLRAECKAEGLGEPKWHAKSRPARTEAEAVSRVLHLAAMADDATVYIAHVSSALGLAEIRKARAQGQKNIFVETCTQYLTLTEERYCDKEKGLNYIMSPPLRTQADVDALWQGLINGEIQTIATDHCSLTTADKARGRGDFTRCPSGAPGIEERFSLLFSEGVAKGRLSLNAFATLVAANPAKLTGLYPKKGAIVPGSDADLIILDPGLDPATEYTLSASDLHGPSDYSVYEGFKLTGRIEAVYLRGSCIVHNNTYLGKPGDGQFMQRGRNMFPG
ncbi:MAG: dihydropyrimidinase [Desulfovibrio sp.]|jgi:dihydropyrimidinase|nr:dihydropyrimidinase [Desulfovibrio sp.]